MCTFKRWEKMELTGTIFLISITILLSTVSCQQSIVSTNTITTGGSFSIYCDAKRVNLVGAKSITQLTIFRKVATYADFSMIAQYTAFAPPGVQKEIKFIPSGRLWNVTFTGSNGGVNNLATMSVVVDVLDAGCSDAGIYRCQVGYYTTDNALHTVNATDQNVTATAGISQIILTASPFFTHPNASNLYNVGDNVTFTCEVYGPDSLEVNWDLWVKNISGTEVSNPIPANSVVVTSIPVAQGVSGGCVQYRVAFKLITQVQPDYDQQTYKCNIIKDHVVKSSNITIGVLGVNIRQPVVSVDRILEHESFVVTCDAGRVTFPASNVDGNTIGALAVHTKLGASQTYTKIAEYLAFGPPDHLYFKKPPAGRNWIFNFIRSDKCVTNTTTMKIEILVQDAKCQDAGLYMCQVMYYSSDNGTSYLQQEQNVSVWCSSKYGIADRHP